MNRYIIQTQQWVLHSYAIYIGIKHLVEEEDESCPCGVQVTQKTIPQESILGGPLLSNSSLLRGGLWLTR